MGDADTGDAINADMEVTVPDWDGRYLPAVTEFDSVLPTPAPCVVWPNVSVVEEETTGFTVTLAWANFVVSA